MSSFCTLKIGSILLSVKCEELQPFFFFFWFLKKLSHICIFLGDIFKAFFLLIFIKRKQKQRCVLRNTAQMLCEKYFSLGSQVLWTKGNTKKVFIELVLCRLRPLLLTKCSWQSHYIQKFEQICTSFEFCSEKRLHKEEMWSGLQLSFISIFPGQVCIASCK